VFAILFFQKEWQFGEACKAEESSNVGHASLREDYLNQVQRDFLSLGCSTSAPLADVTQAWVTGSL
jgi:hypothetical protein